MSSSLRESGWGHITSDVKFFNMESDNPVARVGVAVNLRRKNDKKEWEEYVIYRDVLAFGFLAKRVASTYKRNADDLKGQFITFEGSVDVKEVKGKIYTSIRASDLEINLRGSSAEKAAEQEEAPVGGATDESGAPF